MIRSLPIFLLATLAMALNPLAFGQIRDPLAARGEPVEPKTRLSVGYRLMFNVDFTFNGIGSGEQSPFDPTDFTANRQFADGFVGGEAGPIAPGFTNNYAFDSVDQVSDNPQSSTGRALSLRRLFTDTSGADSAASGDPKGGSGWELKWRRRMLDLDGGFSAGLIFGFGFNSLDAERSLQVQADLKSEVSRFEFPENFNLDGLEDGFDSVLAGNNAVPLLNGQPFEVVGDIDEGRQVPVDESFEIDAAAYTLRLGPVLEWQVLERLRLQMSAGFATMYLDSVFTVDQRIVFQEADATDGTGADIASSQVSRREGQWLLGAFADASAFYRINRGVEVFSGFQYQGLEGFDQPAGTRSADISLDSAVVVELGLGFTF